MPINPISSTSGILRAAEIGIAESGAAQSTGGGGDFGQMLTNALEDLSRADANASDAITRLAQGEDIELHQVMLAMQEADVGFQLAVQVRNKIVEAYQEVMRMQV